MAISATELYELAPLGATVKCSDGTPRPPERFKRKVAEWERSNYFGLFAGCYPGDPTKAWARPTFTLQTSNNDVLVVNRISGLDNAHSYEVDPPAQGTVMAHSEHSTRIEIRHVWPSMAAAREWHVRNRYEFGGCGYRYLIVSDCGSLLPYAPDRDVTIRNEPAGSRGAADLSGAA